MKTKEMIEFIECVCEFYESEVSMKRYEEISKYKAEVIKRLEEPRVLFRRRKAKFRYVKDE